MIFHLSHFQNREFSHSLILRWVQRYVPEFDNKWSRFARPVGTSLRVGETYIKVRGEWEYLYRGTATVLTCT